MEYLAGVLRKPVFYSTLSTPFTTAMDTDEAFPILNSRPTKALKADTKLTSSLSQLGAYRHLSCGRWRPFEISVRLYLWVGRVEPRAT